MFYTVSFSGAGHLLPYHLGVATVLFRAKRRLLLPIKAISGSSSGAIAATVFALLPERLEEYSHRFLQDRGHAFRNLQQMLVEDDKNSDDAVSHDWSPQLSVCTTRCADGIMQLFTFETERNETSTTTSTQLPHIGRILRAVQASCIIPRSFHPFDMFSKQPLSFADEEGTDIDGISYVDGVIAAPQPPASLDGHPLCHGRIEVSPISGPSLHSEYCIRPKDHSLHLAPFLLSTKRCHPFQIRPSIQNVLAMVVSMGIASPNLLKEWYERGTVDANEFVEKHARES